MYVSVVFVVSCWYSAVSLVLVISIIYYFSYYYHCKGFKLLVLI